jgi:hypothetical protein
MYFLSHSGLFDRNFGELASTLSSGVLRDFAVLIQLPPPGRPPYCFVDGTGAKDEQIYLEKSSLRDWN